jgi:Xaa-Pro aminopeptidase
MSAERLTEMISKQEKVDRLLEENSLDGIIFSTNANFKWLSCGGANDVIKNADSALVYLFFTKGKRSLIASRSDAFRVMEEELDGLGYDSIIYNWYEEDVFDGIKKTGFSGKLGADTQIGDASVISDKIAATRSLLIEPELKRYKTLCGEYAKIFTRYCKSLSPSLSEKEIAAGLAFEGNKLGMRFPVLMVGSDDRISSFRHPCSTFKKVSDYVLFATVIEREGICANVTRSVYFGDLPRELAEKQDAVNQVEAVYQHNSRPGITLGELFEVGKKAYDDVGHGGEWENHLQGGIAGYAPLEFLTIKGSEVEVSENNIMGWNPTIKGAKSEDPIHITKDGPIQYTIDSDWPSKEYTVDGKNYKRPLIMEI